MSDATRHLAQRAQPLALDDALLRLLDRPQRRSQIAVETAVLQRDGGLVGEGLEQRDLGLGKDPRLEVADPDHADDLPLHAQGHRQVPAHAARADEAAQVVRVGQRGIVEDVGGPDGHTLPSGASHRPHAGGDHRRHRRERLRLALRGDQLQRAVGLQKAEHRERAPEQAQRALHDTLADVGGVQALGQHAGQPGQLFRLPPPPRRLRIEPGVFHEHRGLVTDAGDEPHLVASEPAALAPPHREEATDRCALDDHGHEEQRLVGEAVDRGPIDPRIVGHVVRRQRPAVPPGLLHAGMPDDRNRVLDEALVEIGRHVIPGDRPQHVAADVGEIRAHHVGVEGPRDLAGDAPHRLGGVERGAHRLADREQRLRLAQPRLRLLEEPCVVDGQRGVGGDGVQELKFLLGEGAGVAVEQRQHAQRVFLERDRNGQHRLVAELLDE